jgi:hypothetical protein
MDNLFIGNLVPPPFSGTSLPEVLSSVLRPARYQALRKSFRNDPDHGSDNRPKLTNLKSESVISFIPES